MIRILFKGHIFFLNTWMRRFLSTVKRFSTEVTKEPENLELIKDYLEPVQRFVSKTPFKTNPFFIPSAPVADASRQEIYTKYCQDSTVNNPRALAEQYGISIVRVEAILRLKALENKFVNDNVAIQTNLTKGMEKMLGSARLNGNRIEPIRESIIKGMHPFIQLVEEEETFQPKVF